MDSEEVFRAMESLLHLVVAFRARRRLFVRAAVVGWRGRAVVICGPPSSGKTTLVEALVRAGASYYSDQYALLDARGRVHPFPGPLLFHDEAEGRPRKCPVETLGGRTGTKPLRVGLVAFTQYQPGARWRPRVLSPAQTMLALLRDTVQARIRSKAALAICRCVAASATTLRGKRGEAADTVLSLLSHLGSGDHDGRLAINSPA